MWPLPCVGVNVLLETKWMAKCLVTHSTFPLPAAHVWTHTLDMSCQIAERGKYLATLTTSVTLCVVKKRENKI